MAMTKHDMLARAVLIVGLAALALLPIGALGSRFGLWHFGTGFQFMFTGTYVSAAVAVLGIAIGFFAWRGGRRQHLAPVGVGVAASLVALAAVGLQYSAMTEVPPIHDVSTDTVDPPRFETMVDLRGPNTNPLDYTPEEARHREQSYPDVETLRLAAAPSDSFDRAVAAARDSGWEIAREDRAGMVLEATATTFWFGFKDDVVVRVRADGAGGSLVDARSVSRVGMSDLGANAARITAFLRRLEG